MTTGIMPVLSPYAFSEAMERHWADTLGNASSQALRAVWQQMAHAFGSCLLAIGDIPWQILQPPTGSGKTEGTALYCGRLAQQNLESENPAGVLIVTRLKSQCDEMVGKINKHARSIVAAAHHSDHMLSHEQLNGCMILVVTHAAFTKAMEGLAKETFTKWHDFANWSHGPRKLTVVDEALSGIVQHHKVSLASLGHVLGLARPYKAAHPNEVEALEALCQALEARAKTDGLGSELMWAKAPNRDLKLPTQFDLYSLRKTIERKTKLDELLMGTSSSVDRLRGAAQNAETLRAADAILRSWVFYQRKGVEHTANSAMLLIPKDEPRVVCMDATASQSDLWHLLGDRVTILPVPIGARSYSNVTLYVARSRGVGKQAMTKNAETRLRRLSSELGSRLSSDNRTLVCVHKKVEPIAIRYLQRDNVSIAHWGALDGLNDWQDCDTVVLFGLPYRDEAWARGMIGATKGVEAESLMSLGHLQQRQLSVSVIQAINRVRCRKVIDSEGNCPPTHVYIILPRGEDGDAILEAIEKEMPKVQMKPWLYTLDGPTASVRAGSFHEAIVSYMATQPPGMVYLSTLKDALKIGCLKSVRNALNDATSTLSMALSEIGVAYVRQGRGRATRTYLTKTA